MKYICECKTCAAFAAWQPSPPMKKYVTGISSTSEHCRAITWHRTPRHRPTRSDESVEGAPTSSKKKVGKKVKNIIFYLVLSVSRFSFASLPLNFDTPQKVQVSQSCIIMTSPPHQKSSSGKSIGVREFNREQFNNRGTHCLTALGVAGRYRIFTTVNDLKNKHTNPFWAFSARRALVCFRCLLKGNRGNESRNISVHFGTSAQDVTRNSKFEHTC